MKKGSKFMEKAISRITDEERSVTVSWLGMLSCINGLDDKTFSKRISHRFDELHSAGYHESDTDEKYYERSLLSKTMKSKTQKIVLPVGNVWALDDEYFNSFINSAAVDLRLFVQGR